MQFVNPEDVTSLFSKHGFLALDVDNDAVLGAMALEAGADILVTDELGWERDGYKLTSQVLDVGRNKKLAQFQTKIVQAVPDSGGQPLVIRDKDSGVSLLIPRGGSFNSSWYPQCDKCVAEPNISPQARKDGVEGTVKLLVTVSEQGTTGHIDVVNSLKDGLSEQAGEAVHAWRFRPAVGADGKPFAVRIPVEVGFHLM